MGHRSGTRFLLNLAEAEQSGGEASVLFPQTKGLIKESTFLLSPSAGVYTLASPVRELPSIELDTPSV